MKLREDSYVANRGTTAKTCRAAKLKALEVYVQRSKDAQDWKRGDVETRRGGSAET